MNSFLIGISTWISPEVSSPGRGALWESRPRFLSGTSLQRCHRSWPDVPMTSLAEAFGLGRGCFGREGVLRCTGTFPETGGGAYLSSCRPPYRRPVFSLSPPSGPSGAGLLSAPIGATELGGQGFGTRRELQCAQVAQGLREWLMPPLPSPARSLQVLCALSNGRITKVTQQKLRSLARRSAGA